MNPNISRLKTKHFLFLDRDGVINVHRPNDYVKALDEFVFLPRALEALVKLSKHFSRIVIVTNQRGVSKGKMHESAVQEVHAYLQKQVEDAGGKIDGIYYCIHLDDNHPNRKPNSGMAFEAKKHFPEIDFSQSMMVGDSRSDIEFGNRLGMTTVLIKKEKPGWQKPVPDFIFSSLAAIAELWEDNANYIGEDALANK
ncbi:D-glycero-alpha-D-manno-heptose-1,7-bisphosphate 7-phosphatase [Microbacter margulisiae]|uniref:D,D-heptose 1,7-bisphosphate phosphatase n=1 Tax=Microbacter margulisiae TaxID=1350067 RepID=A0A7W5H2B8_9PORP|nr:HAD family hydrolase [Microbacter margulisiae]MBB3187251.1 histidinol-phosphate phosphatase family protein [Microbacter margulisiae]